MVIIASVNNLQYMRETIINNYIKLLCNKMLITYVNVRLLNAENFQ